MEEIKMWVSVNMLELEEFVGFFLSQCAVHDSPFEHLKFGDTVVGEAPSVKNKTLCMQKAKKKILYVSCTLPTVKF